jgi:hypothetical protein
MAPASVRQIELRTAGPEGRALVDLAETFERNMSLLNAQLYGPLDYAVTARKG